MFLFCWIPLIASSNYFHAYLSLLDFVRISNNAPANCPSFLAARSILTCSSVNGWPALYDNQYTQYSQSREVYIFSSSRLESLGSVRAVVATFAFLRSLAWVRKVNVSLKPADSASPLISIFPPAATSSTELRGSAKARFWRPYINFSCTFWKAHPSSFLIGCHSS